MAYFNTNFEDYYGPRPPSPRRRLARTMGVPRRRVPQFFGTQLFDRGAQVPKPPDPATDSIGTGPGPDGGPTVPPPSSGNPIYDAIVAAANKMHSNQTWTQQYRDKIMEMIPAAEQAWGSDKILKALQGEWPLYALQILMSSLGIGPGVYSKTGEGKRAGLVNIPGFAPQGYENEIDVEGYGGPGLIY